MNDETRHALNAFLQTILKAADDAATFSIDQAPLLVREYLWWYGAEAALTLMGCLIAVAAVWLMRRASLRSEVFTSEDAYGQREWRTNSAAMALIVTLVLSLYAFQEAKNLTKVIVAPRVVIVQELAGWVSAGR